MSFTKINHYEKEYADTHHECKQNNIHINIFEM